MSITAVLLGAYAFAVTGASAPPATDPKSAPAATFTAGFRDLRYEGAPLDGAYRNAPKGSYLNPVLTGSISDPSIVRVGSDYYLAASSFNHWPGIPIFHSRDLVNWTQVAAAVSRPGQMKIEGLDTWQGLYAPDLKWHDGRFYLLGTCYSCGGNFIMTAASASGPWSPPTWLPFDGIDPSIFFDDDGGAYVLNNGLPSGGPRWDGHRAIWLQEIDLRTLRLKGPRTTLVDGGSRLAERPFWVEGPHIVKKHGKYILLCAEGGTKERHSEVAFRSDTLRGPYTAFDRPILTQVGLPADRAHPIVQAGHADLVQTQAGDWWAVFLASRPFGPGELDYTTGRETFLLPVSWTNGWPEILPPGAAVPTAPARPKLPAATGDAPAARGGAYSPRWNGPGLDRRWVMLGSPTRSWWRVAKGEVKLTAISSTLGSREQPALLAIRQSDPVASLRAAVDLPGGESEGEAGLVAYAGTHFYWSLMIANRADGQREVRLRRRIGAADPESGEVIARAVTRASGPARLRITLHGPKLRFDYWDRRSWHQLGAVQDGRSLAVSRTGGFSGTLLGMAVTENPKP